LLPITSAEVDSSSGQLKKRHIATKLKIPNIPNSKLETQKSTEMERKEDVLDYINRYCAQYRTAQEQKAIDHHTAQVKFFRLKDRHQRIREIYDRMTSKDPAVLALLKDGYDELVRRAAHRIYYEYFGELPLNCCPKCNGIARTPEARQCRYCGHDWH